MKWKTPERRSYYSKYEQVEIKNHQDWFECYKLPGDIYAICEPQHLQEVNVFLIFGEERALLLDTGMGIRNIKPVVEEICAAQDERRAAWNGVDGMEYQPYMDGLTVVNCHCHFDHTGNNWRFPEVWVSNQPLVRKQSVMGVGHMPLANQTDEDMFLFDYPEGFEPEKYCIKPYKIKPCPDGHIFHLGNRDIEFVLTPGHTEDHAMLYDHKYQILFAGDMIYFGAIYVQFGNDVMGHSDIGQYIDSLIKVKARFPKMRSIYVSHNDFITTRDTIGVLVDALGQVQDGTAEGEPLQDEKFGYYQDPPTMRQYFFDGFSIVAAK